MGILKAALAITALFLGYRLGAALTGKYVTPAVTATTTTT